MGVRDGLVKFDLESDAIIAKSEQPLSEFAREHYPHPDDYPHNSAHHGLAMSGDGTKLCDAGTIDNTVSIVSTGDLSVLRTIPVGNMPYWASTGVAGELCFVSLSRDNEVSVVDYETMEEVATIPTGRFPQRNRLGRISLQTRKLLAGTVQ